MIHRPPTRFEIMRRNRGFGDYMHHKAKLLAQIDCCELEVLRTCRDTDEIERVAGSFAPGARAAEAYEQTIPIQGAPQAILQAPHKPAPARRRGWLSRLFNFSMGFGENA